jgi:hypothetical protein
MCQPAKKLISNNLKLTCYSIAGVLLLTTMFIESLPDGCNYVELIITSDDDANDRTVHVGLSREVFTKYLEMIKLPKYFTKHAKCFQYQNMIYENSHNEDIKVMTKTINKIEHLSKKLTICIGKKEKQPFHMFPSTTSLDSMYYVNRLIFRFHNRVYLNFETITYIPKRNVVFKVYINYNHDNNVDVTSINQCIESIVNMLQVS